MRCEGHPGGLAGSEAEGKRVDVWGCREEGGSVDVAEGSEAGGRPRMIGGWRRDENWRVA